MRLTFELGAGSLGGNLLKGNQSVYVLAARLLPENNRTPMNDNIRRTTFG